MWRFFNVPSASVQDEPRYPPSAEIRGKLAVRSRRRLTFAVDFRRDESSWISGLEPSSRTIVGVTA
jgi:hypothetical protein